MKQPNKRQQKENHATRFAYHVAMNLQEDLKHEKEDAIITRVNRCYSAVVREYEGGQESASLYIAAIALASAVGKLAIQVAPRTGPETLVLSGERTPPGADTQRNADSE